MTSYVSSINLLTNSETKFSRKNIEADDELLIFCINIFLDI